MKIAPVSGDLLVKGALMIGGVLLAVWAVRRISGAATDAAGAAWDATSQAVRDGAWAVTPWNNNNVIYQGVNGVLFPDGSDTLGTRAYQLADDLAQWWNETTAPTGWHTGEGRWNNPSAYTVERGGVTPGYSGSGGAAFGIYPRP